MGVLNVTPDSFSDGGKFFALEKAVEHGAKMAAEGADIIDVGGESTRPDAEPVPVDEELRRAIPVIEQLRKKINIRISIDTSKAPVAHAAIQAGATIVNDVTGGRGDEGMMPLIAGSQVAFIMMHMQGTPKTMQIAPRYDDVVSELADFFRQQYSRALQFGLDPMRLAFDPGIGFGKTAAQNFEILRNMDRLAATGFPILVGTSRKSFIGSIIKKPASELVLGTGATVAASIVFGAHMVRVHDVAAIREVADVTDAIVKAEK